MMVFLNRSWALGLIFGIVLSSLSQLTLYFLRRLLYPSGSANSSDERILTSSVWCQTGPLGERLCKFRNICYDPHYNEFQFIMTDESVISGVQEPRLWLEIDLSSVEGHNAFKMKLSIISADNKFRRKPVSIQHEPTFIAHRFKPDNVMHVIHDDLIPLYSTIESIFGESAINRRSIYLAFTDSHSGLDEWYSHFSKNLIKLPSLQETHCFDLAYAGLLRSTLWFNYGFKDLQGPYINNNFNKIGIKNFVKFTLDSWHIKSHLDIMSHKRYNKVIIVKRAHTRRILNLPLLKTALQRAHKEVYPQKELVIVEVDFAVNDVHFILSEISEAKLLIGMHGAGMILSLFLPPSSGIVELFPFGISPENVSFLKALLMQAPPYPLNYFHWCNQNRDKSFESSQTSPLMGGITHLPQHLQDQIKSISKVPAVKCCHDPAYLYYIYHDTLVSDDIYYTIHQALSNTVLQTNEEWSLSHYVYPALPSFIKCTIKGSTAHVQWGEISNFHENRMVWFHITMLNGKRVILLNVTDSNLREVSLQLEDSSQPTQLWFQPLNNKNVSGHIKHSECVKYKLIT